MRKILAVVLLALLVPAAAFADDIENPEECAAHGDGVFVYQIPLNNSEPGQADRGSACVNAGGTQVLYIGGELQGEDEWHNNGPCGAVVVNGEEITDEGETGFTHEECD